MAHNLWDFQFQVITISVGGVSILTGISVINRCLYDGVMEGQNLISIQSKYDEKGVVKCDSSSTLEISV